MKSLGLFAFLCSFAAAQSVSIGGDVPHPKTLNIEAIHALPQVELESKDGKFSGPLLIHLLAQAGQETGDKLRGTQVTKTVLVECEDAYRVSFSLAELDPEFRDTRVILATRKNGQPLSPQEGPFRIIVEGDKKLARWARRVKSIQVIWPQ
jgi:DMSO/TMAO reductase YedYZ molybdopterin-dependent catalytic subunit